jgi:uncharacterized protein (DUF2236 family)
MDFVNKSSVVRKIWGSPDTVLFIFAGAAAEFALNKSVDWLYFTGKLPNAPIDRLLSTASYARNIIFSDEKSALETIDKMTKIHHSVERRRGELIPNSAYQDVLYLLIYYSIASFELLDKKLSKEEKEEVYAVFLAVGNRMGIENLPTNFDDWLISRATLLNSNLEHSKYTTDLYSKYKKSLGLFRNVILLESQKMLVPQNVRKLLSLQSFSILKPCLSLYKILRNLNLHKRLYTVLLPAAYKKQIIKLEYGNAQNLKGKCPFHSYRKLHFN